ncbi:MAG: hypothetical protein IKO80_01110 [Lachnospiraceae bacterium]|nr:hypothetical protein [Lachnospiraceae bacterium]
MINLVVTAIVTVCVALLKGTVSVILFLLKFIWRICRLLLSLLPVSGIALAAVCVYLVAFSFTGTDLLPPQFPYHPAGEPFLHSFGALILFIGDLYRSLPGILGIVIILAAVILGIPVLIALLLAHGVIALLPVIPVVFAAEIVVSLLYGIISRKTPFTQIRDRYYFLFPARADRHYERTYHDWLRRHADEFENDTYGRGYRGEEEEEDDDGEVYEERPRRKREERRARRQRWLEAYYDDEPEDGEDDGFDDGEAYEEPASSGGRDRTRDGHRSDDAYERTRESREDRRRSFQWYEAEDEDGRERRRSRTQGRDRERERERERRSAEERDPAQSSFDFFAGCKDLAGVEKKYRSLVKIYHPDNQDGDTSALQEINAQYEAAKRRFRT